jgi:hypothetical protein
MDMTSDQRTTYDAVRSRVMELILKENPYQTTKAIGDRMGVYWAADVSSRGQSVATIPYEGTPKKAVSTIPLPPPHPHQALLTVADTTPLSDY